MQVGQFPASAANSLIEGYCDDFVSLAAVLAQTLEQVSMRGISFGPSRPALERIENGMRELATAIHELLERGAVTTEFATVLGKRDPTPQPGGPKAGPQAPQHTPQQQPPHVHSQTSFGQGKTDFHRTGASPAGPGAPRPPAGTATPTGTHLRPPPAPSTPVPTAPSHQPQATQPPAPHAGLRGPRAAPNMAAAQTPRATENTALRGTNASMPLVSVFQFLGRTRKSGTMEVVIGAETMAFEFAMGCVQLTMSDRCPPEERLGELLQQLGFTTRERIAPVLHKLGDDGAGRLGETMVKERLLTEGQLMEALEKQVQMRFHRACQAKEASYEFRQGQRLPDDGRIRVAPFELVFEQQRTRKPSPPAPGPAPAAPPGPAAGPAPGQAPGPGPTKTS